MQTVCTLQHKIDILENPSSNVASSSNNMVYCHSQPQASWVDDLVAGAHEWIARFILGRVNDQIEILEKQVSVKEASLDSLSEGRSGINGEQEPHPDPHQIHGMYNRLYESLMNSDSGVHCS